MADILKPASTDATDGTLNVKQQLSKLQDAAEDLASTRTIDHEDRAAASSAAHQIAEALDTAGPTDAATKAHDVVATLDHAGLPQPERLQQQVEALSESLHD